MVGIIQLGRCIEPLEKAFEAIPANGKAKSQTLDSLWLKGSLYWFNDHMSRTKPAYLNKAWWFVPIPT